MRTKSKLKRRHLPRALPDEELLELGFVCQGQTQAGIRVQGVMKRRIHQGGQLPRRLIICWRGDGREIREQKVRQLLKTRDKIRNKQTLTRPKLLF